MARRTTHTISDAGKSSSRKTPAKKKKTSTSTVKKEVKDIPVYCENMFYFDSKNRLIKILDRVLEEGVYKYYAYTFIENTYGWYTGHELDIVSSELDMVRITEYINVQFKECYLKDLFGKIIMGQDGYCFIDEIIVKTNINGEKSLFVCSDKGEEFDIVQFFTSKEIIVKEIVLKSDFDCFEVNGEKYVYNNGTLYLLDADDGTIIDLGTVYMKYYEICEELYKIVVKKD